MTLCCSNTSAKTRRHENGLALLFRTLRVLKSSHLTCTLIKSCENQLICHTEASGP